MPIYEYQCKKCKHRFEKIQSFKDKPIKKCPECGGSVEQLLHAPAVQFKGAGWYVTDYAKKSGGGSSSRSEEPASESSDGAGSETKPEAPVDKKPSAKKKSKPSQ